MNVGLSTIFSVVGYFFLVTLAVCLVLFLFVLSKLLLKTIKKNGFAKVVQSFLKGLVTPPIFLLFMVALWAVLVVVFYNLTKYDPKTLPEKFGFLIVTMSIPLVTILFAGKKFFGQKSELTENWERPLTQKEIKRNKQIEQNINALNTVMEEDKPIHPETGEEGTFIRYEGSYPHIKPVYRTKSGKEFTKQQLQ